MRLAGVGVWSGHLRYGDENAIADAADELDAAPEPWPSDARVLAALRPKMLELARDRAGGAHPYFVPVEHVARARAILGPDRMIGVELAVVLDANPSTARETARRHTSI